MARELRARRFGSDTSTSWLLLTVLILLLMLLGRQMVSVAIANSAQADLSKSAVNDLPDPVQTLPRFKTALMVWPSNLTAQRGLWRSLILAGRHEEAEAAIETLPSRTPQREFAAMTLGLLRLSQGDRDDALNVWQSLGPQVGDLAILFNSARKQGGVTFESPLLPGQAVIIDGRLVRDLAEAGIRAGHPDVWLYLMIGDYYQFEEKDYEQALHWYMAGRQAHPTSFIPPAYAASLLLHLDRYEESRQLFREAFTKCPWPRDDYLAAVARSYLHEGRPDLAVTDLERAVAIAPGNPEWHRLLGDVYSAVGRVKEAREQYEEARRLQEGS